ncbi:MAG: ketol-acid reductoisomerase [Planctomycetes bacterium]|nr:ketol-acid reductoisomerase [Planctomycetota bacterium]
MRLANPTEADLAVLDGRTVAVVGYGSQGHAHALNLRDSGVNVLVAQRRGGAGHRRAVADGFKPVSAGEAARTADLLIFALPDETAAVVYDQEIAAGLHGGQTLGFVHGFNIRYGFIEPPEGVDIIMVAPKGPGTLVRSLYQEGKGLPALMAIERDATGRARATALAWAKGIGATRAGVVETTFAVETETDLFGEQVVLCGGVISLMKAAFETLVEAGYEPEFAYLECIHELKQIVDLLYKGGLDGMHRRISNTAAYGGLTRGPRLVNDESRRAMKQILEDVRSGAFAREWIAEHRAGSERFDRLREVAVSGKLEEAGRAIRKLMPWLDE